MTLQQPFARSAQLLWFSEFSLHGPDENVELCKADYGRRDHGWYDSLQNKKKQLDTNLMSPFSPYALEVRVTEA